MENETASYGTGPSAGYNGSGKEFVFRGGGEGKWRLVGGEGVEGWRGGQEEGSTSGIGEGGGRGRGPACDQRVR